MSELFFSLSKQNGDFVVQPFKGSGKGGQKRNKTMSACRIIHPASGAISECQEERSFYQNRNKAFERLAEKSEFKRWMSLEIARRQGVIARAKEDVEKAMDVKNLRFETQVDGRWVVVDPKSILEDKPE